MHSRTSLDEFVRGPITATVLKNVRCWTAWLRQMSPRPQLVCDVGQCLNSTDLCLVQLVVEVLAERRSSRRESWAPCFHFCSSQRQAALVDMSIALRLALPFCFLGASAACLVRFTTSPPKSSFSSWNSCLQASVRSAQRGR